MNSPMDRALQEIEGVETMKRTTPITGYMIRAVRKLYRPEHGGWPIRMERYGAVAVYRHKNPQTGRHVRFFGIKPV